jgi:seryl-tRNA synthetase
MHDIKLIRDNPTAFNEALARREHPPVGEQIVELDRFWREKVTDNEMSKHEANRLNREIGLATQRGEPTGDLLERVRLNVPKEHEVVEAKSRLDYMLSHVPNLPDPTIQAGREGVILSHSIEMTKNRPALALPRTHEALASMWMDFETAAKLSGSRFVVLKGPLAKMERALGAWMLDQMTINYGFEEIAPPLLVKPAIAYGAGNLPKSAEDMFFAGDPQTGHYLIPTSEMVLANLHCGEIIDEALLPLRYTALTPCFRSEAGAAGKDTKGMIRLHQFNKVEIFAFTTPEESEAEHARMLEAAIYLLNMLELPHRVVLLGAADMGFQSRKTFDLEVWMPGQNAFREISSVSNCGDFQCRRTRTRFKRGKENLFPHTLNGSALAVGRTMAAIIENYQEFDGSIGIPKALQPYMGGQTRL